MNKHISLNDGNKIPVLGLGTWKSENDMVGKAVEYALTNAGYTHIDCAAIYRNEKEIGSVFHNLFNNTLKRQDVFITSKLWNTFHKRTDVEKACKNTLKDLRLDYLDLYLIHWGIAFKAGSNIYPEDKNGKVVLEPVPIQETWQAMEDLVKKGLVKSIGVSNFTTVMLLDLFTYAKINPAVNQIELHPYNSQEDLVNFCHNNGIAVTGYSPLGRQGALDKASINLFTEPIIKTLSKKYSKTPAQILLNWALSRNTIVIPKSTNPGRISENSEIFDFEITQKDKGSINSLNRNHRFVDPDWLGTSYFS